MLTEIEKLHSSILESVGKSITLTYDSNSSQLTWGGTDGQNFIDVDDTTVVTVTLSNATFAANPITFISSSEHFTIGNITSTELIFQINSAPSCFLNPFALSFNVNANGVNGISSPPLFMTLRPGSTEGTPSTIVNVHYSLNNGSFTLDESGAPLASEVLLINAIAPPLKITFILSSLPTGQDVTFNSNQSNMPGAWEPKVSSNKQQLQVTIPAAASKFASFQFSIKVNGVTVISPDPILVNATIGDGSGN